MGQQVVVEMCDKSLCNVECFIVVSLSGLSAVSQIGLIALAMSSDFCRRAYISGDKYLTKAES
jgi:hypothetical protein